MGARKKFRRGGASPKKGPRHGEKSSRKASTWRKSPPIMRKMWQKGHHMKKGLAKGPQYSNKKFLE